MNVANCRKSTRRSVYVSCACVNTRSCHSERLLLTVVVVARSWLGRLACSVRFAVVVVQLSVATTGCASTLIISRAHCKLAVCFSSLKRFSARSTNTLRTVTLDYCIQYQTFMESAAIGCLPSCPANKSPPGKFRQYMKLL
jgi:hypothetical protein